MSKIFGTNYKSPNLITKKCDDECRRKIERKLSNIRNATDLDDINYTFSEMEMILDRSSISEIEEQMKMWRYLSRLAIYLHSDYKFFSQLIVKTTFYCPSFDNAMKSLGYVKKGNAWFQEEKPELSVIINTIFNYCFYCSLFKSMQTEDTEKCKRLCSLCESELSLLSDACPICYTVNEDNKIQILEQIISHPCTLDNKIQSNVEETNYKMTEGNYENPKTTKTSDNEESGICLESTFSDNNKFCFTPKSPSTNIIQLNNKKDDDIKNKRNEDKNTNDSVPVTKENIEDQWACKACTFKNNQDALNCNAYADFREELSSLTSLTTDLLSINDTVKEPVNTEIEEEKELKNQAPENSEAPKSMVTIRSCFKCNQVKVENELMLCIECSKTDSICVNKACTGLIPIKDKWCPSCGVKKDADLKYANCVEVRKRFKIIKKKWQCGFCYTLMNKYTTHCKKCNNSRDSFLE